MPTAERPQPFANLGKTVMLLRQIRGWSQAQLAVKAGLGKSQLSKYETGKELPKLESLERLLAVFDIGGFEFFYFVRMVDLTGELVRRSTERPAAMAAGHASLALTGGILGPREREAFRLVQACLTDVLHAIIDGPVRRLPQGAA